MGERVEEKAVAPEERMVTLERGRPDGENWVVELEEELVEEVRLEDPE